MGERDELLGALVGSKEWIRKFAEEHGMTYHEIMRAAQNYQAKGIILKDSSLEGEDLPGEFWDHFEVMTGEKVSERGSFFPEYGFGYSESDYGCGC